MLGLEAEGEELKVRLEEEEKEREVRKVVSRRTREKVMDLSGMMEKRILRPLMGDNSYVISLLLFFPCLSISFLSPSGIYVTLRCLLMVVWVGRRGF